MKRMAEETVGYEERSEEEKVALVLDEDCRDLKAGKAIECIRGEKDSLLQRAKDESIVVPQPPHLMT